ncbi:MAG: hypothetical protein PHY99_10725 [Bacteroidales bacterium]|nr:hypothetical protein [Bacteroidales bacterium]
MKSKLIAFLILALVSCDPESFDVNNPNGERVPQGTLVVDFPISHNWLPSNKIIRTELHVASNLTELARGNFIQSANLFNTQEYYTFLLPPGNYNIEAAVACLCEGDSCSAGGFPGNKWGEKHATYPCTITDNATTKLTIQFLK